MRTTAEALVGEIRAGEDSRLELKEVRFAGGRVRAPHARVLADEIAAFANASGGTLVLGVEDKRREILGIPQKRLDAVVTHVTMACRDLISPALDIIVERIAVPDTMGQMRFVVRVAVEESFQVHRSPGGVFKRFGDQKQAISPDEIARLMSHRGRRGIIRFDEEVVPAASLTDLDAGRIRFFGATGTPDDDKTLAVKLGMARQHRSDQIRPTVTGILMACSSPRRWLPNAFIQAVAYRGRFPGDTPPDLNYQLDAKDIEGTLDTQIADACRFVARNQRVGAHKSLARRDYPQFDMASVFEAVVNAVAHRDYSIHGSKVRLRMFDDRLELYSPGALPNNLTVDALLYRQESRNGAIVSLLARCPVPDNVPWLATFRSRIMDTRGDGVRVILRNGESHSGRMPEFAVKGGTELILTIYAADVDRRRHDDSDDWLESDPGRRT